MSIIENGTGFSTVRRWPKHPRCGSEMVLRRAKTGAHAGKEFWGCSMYGKTKCGGIRDFE
jgi:restriction system protein